MTNFATSPRLSPSYGAARAEMERGISQVARAAQSIARGEINPRNATDLIEGQRTMAANAQILQATDEKVGTLLNVAA